MKRSSSGMQGSNGIRQRRLNRNVLRRRTPRCRDQPLGLSNDSGSFTGRPVSAQNLNQFLIRESNASLQSRGRRRGKFNFGRTENLFARSMPSLFRPPSRPRLPDGLACFQAGRIHDAHLFMSSSVNNPFCGIRWQRPFCGLDAVEMRCLQETRSPADIQNLGMM